MKILIICGKELLKQLKMKQKKKGRFLGIY